jgi:environmental stress-induced protein Ves|tara:strand:- start:2328 stop:2933 length:606 start_codon:yes stop_codon:yes gene_type:complete
VKLNSINKSQFRPQKWKNGRGTTLELFNAKADSWTDLASGRITIAEISSDGPFSVFPNTDRTTTLIEGQGLTLHIGEEKAVSLQESFDSFSYPGGKDIKAFLQSDKVRVLNVFTDSTLYAHNVDILNGEDNSRLITGGHNIFFFALSGSPIISGPNSFETQLDEFSLLSVQAEKGGVWSVNGGIVQVIIIKNKVSHEKRYD